MGYATCILSFYVVLVIIILFSGGCGAINVGKWRGIERTARMRLTIW